VYGVVRADELPAVAAEGVAGTPVELLERGDLAALVSRLLRRDFRVKRRDLQRHLDVLEEAFAEATIVPCPFGTVVRSDEDVESVDDAGVEAAGEYVVLKASFLASRKKLAAFDAKLERVADAEQPMIRIEVIGPLPPTAFAAEAAGG